jgi:peroxiredoxin
MRPDIAPGATFPDYELPDETGKRRRLSELQGNDPLALILSRGSYCPKDQRQHRLLVDMEDEIAVSYSHVVTISSTDSLMGLREWKTALGAHWTFLRDEHREVQRDLDIQEYTDPHHDPMIPHTIMLEPGLKVFRIYNGYWFWGRPTPEELRQDFREITRRCRPDWDLATPGLRERWEAKQKREFYPYAA